VSDPIQLRPASAGPDTGEGRWLTWGAWGLIALGALALLSGAATGRGAAALAGLEAGWLFLTGLAAGAVALSAAVRLAHGRWADELLHLAEAGARFFRPSLALLLLLLLGRALAGAAAAELLGGAFLLAAGLLVAGLGGRFARLVRAPGTPPWRQRGAGAGYLVAYAVGLSVFAWVLAPDLAARPSFTVVPPLYFMGAFLSGIAGVALVAALRGLGGEAVRHDLGKLLFGQGIFWGYLTWSLILPTWYGHLPEELTVLTLRWSGPARPLAGLVLAGVLGVPFVLLLGERWKRRRGPLAVGSATTLLGLAGACHLMTRPPHGPLDPWGLLVTAGVAAGLAAVFWLSVRGGLAGPAPPAPSDPPEHPSPSTPHARERAH
jgi:hypothetical protein